MEKYIDSVKVDNEVYPIKDNAAVHIDEFTNAFINALSDPNVQLALLDRYYPVGTPYFTEQNKNPADILGGGQWTRLEDQFILAGGTNFRPGTTGGWKDASIVAHTHPTTPHKHDINHGHTGDINGNPFYYVMSKNKNDALSYQVAHSTTSGYYTNVEKRSGMFDKKWDVRGMNPKTESGDTTVVVNSPTNAVASTNKNMPPYKSMYGWIRVA